MNRQPFQTVQAGTRILAGILHGKRAFGGPPQVALALTDRCNLRCIHCFLYSPLVRTPNFRQVQYSRKLRDSTPPSREGGIHHLTDGDPLFLRSVIDQSLSQGTRRFQFSGAGEVFLHPEVMEFFGRCKKRGARCHTNTNGTLLTKEIIDELIAMEFDELRVTTMAGTADMYRRTHPGVSPKRFDRLRDMLLYLADRKKALGKTHPRLMLVTIVVSENLDGIEDFARFAAEMKADNVQFRPFHVFGDADLSPLRLSDNRSFELPARLSTCARVLELADIGHNIPVFCSVLSERNRMRFYESMPCYYGWLHMMVDIDGSAYACCRCNEPMGNLLDSTLRDVWHGAAWNRMRQRMLAMNRTKQAPEYCGCGDCPHVSANLKVHRILHPRQRVLPSKMNPSP